MPSESQTGAPDRPALPESDSALQLPTRNPNQPQGTVARNNTPGGALAAGRDVSVRVRAVAVSGAMAQLIVDGKPAGPMRPIAMGDQEIGMPIAGARRARWFAVMVVRDGRPLLIGNPIFLR